MEVWRIWPLYPNVLRVERADGEVLRVAAEVFDGDERLAEVIRDVMEERRMGLAAPQFVGSGDDPGYIHHSARVGGEPEHKDWVVGETGLAPIIDKSARLEALVTVDAGIARETQIGARSWLLKKSHVGHDAWIGDDVTIATGAIVGGYAIVEDGAKIGLNAVVLPYRRIGKGAHIGACSCVTRDVPAGEVWAGNPARRLENRDPRPHSERVA